MTEPQTNLVALRDPPRVVTPPLSYVTILESPRQFGTHHLRDLTPSTVRAILDESEGGKLDRWNDLVDKMYEDEHLSSVVDTRISPVARAPYTLEPGHCEPGQEAIAKLAVELCEEQLKRIEDIERLFADLLDGTMRGLSAVEHEWYRAPYRGMRGWFTRPFWVPAKEFRYAADWAVQVRTGKRVWVDLPDAKFILHVPRIRSMVPTKCALLRSAVWTYVFKFWAWTFWVNGAERLGNPLMLGRVPQGAHASVRAALKLALESLSADQIGILEGETKVEFPDANFAPSAEVWHKIISTCDLGFSKCVLGSTLNVEVTDTGGAYAAATSQSDTTITPRLESDAMKLSGTMERDLFGPFLRFNPHLTNGVVAPTPRLKFQLRDPSKKQISAPVFTALVAASAIRKNELRELAGMDKLTVAEGGEEFVAPPVAAPAFARAEVAQVPLANTITPMSKTPRAPDVILREPRIPLSTYAEVMGIPLPSIETTPSSSPTSTPSANPVAKLLEEL